MDATIIYDLIRDKIKHIPNFHNIDYDSRKDIIQDTFISIYEKFQENKIDISTIESYVFIACRNNVIKHFKTNKRIKGDIIPIDINYNLPQETYATPFEDEVNDRLKEYLFNNISFDFEKEVFKLKLAGYSITEICEKLSINVKQYENILNSNIRHIKKKLNQKEEKDKRARRLVYYLKDQNDNILKFTKKLDLSAFLKIDQRRLPKLFKQGYFKDYTIWFEFDANKLLRK